MSAPSLTVMALGPVAAGLVAVLVMLRLDRGVEAALSDICDATTPRLTGRP